MPLTVRRGDESLFWSKSGIQGVEQSRVTEWLEQTVHRTIFDHSRANVFVFLSGDEYDRNLVPAESQFPLKVGSRHPRHGNVEDKTSGPLDTAGCEEFFR